MSQFPTTLIEWGATLLSLAGFWLCIRHRAVCFLVFLVADAGWFVSAWVNFHPSLLAQQAVYIRLNVVGYWMWRKDERLQAALESVEKRALQPEAPKVPKVANVSETPTDVPVGIGFPLRPRPRGARRFTGSRR